MPLSNADKRVLHEQQRKDDEQVQKKRKLSDTVISNNKRSKTESEEYIMTESQKRANFSALPNPGTNGVHRHASPLGSNKPGTTKKLVIKNFKGVLLVLFPYCFDSVMP